MSFVYTCETVIIELKIICCLFCNFCFFNFIFVFQTATVLKTKPITSAKQLTNNVKHSEHCDSLNMEKKCNVIKTTSQEDYTIISFKNTTCIPFQVVNGVPVQNILVKPA